MNRLSLLAVLLAAGVAPAAAPVPTFNRDIAPLVWKHCAGCHRPGEVGPFPLLTYRDVSKRGKFIAEVTGNREMPPWKAEAGFGAFHDDRRLTDAQLKLIDQWVSGGMLEGAASDLPPQPKFSEGWQLGKPDLVLKMPEAFTVPAGGRDIQQCFPIPIPLDEDRTVSAVEFRPGSSSVVHHAILYLDRNGQARRKDAKEDGPGFKSFGGPGFVPSGGLGAWTPGTVPRHFPDGVGRMIAKGSDLVVQIHYHPSGKEEVDRSTVGLYFTKTPAKKLVAGVGLRNRDIRIPAGAKQYVRTAETAPLPADVIALGITPHMHYVGREMKVEAHLPDGKTVPLIWIKDWDFNWQGAYGYREPFVLPKGTVLKLRAVYDNSADNPHNPNTPPKLVRYGEGTNDEMCLCALQVTTENPADLRKVVTMRGNIIGAVLEGGIRPGDIGQRDIGDVFPPNGLPISDRAKGFLGKYDLDRDGMLTADEYEKMPALVRMGFERLLLNRIQQEMTQKK